VLGLLATGAGIAGLLWLGLSGTVAQHGSIPWWTAWAAWSALVVGGALYLYGSILWFGRAARRLRIGGAGLVTGVLIIPSTITLARPVGLSLWLFARE